MPCALVGRRGVKVVIQLPLVRGALVRDAMRTWIMEARLVRAHLIRNASLVTTVTTARLLSLVCLTLI